MTDRTPKPIIRAHLQQPRRNFPGASHSAVAPFFHGHVVVMDWSSSPNGNSVKMRLVDDEFVHPFKGLNADKKRHGAGQRLHLEVSLRDAVIYNSQAILTWRGDDSLNGQCISLRLDAENANPFHNIRTEYHTGLRKREGDILLLKVFLVDDNETKISPKRSFAELSPTIQSQIKCRQDQDFQHFCADNLLSLLEMCGEEIPEGVDIAEMSHSGMAGFVVKLFCGISSRKELSEDTRHGFDARMKWKLLLKLYEASPENETRYERWSQTQQVRTISNRESGLP